MSTVRDLFLKIGEATNEPERFKTAVGMISSVVQELEVDVLTMDVGPGEYDPDGGNTLEIRDVQLSPRYVLPPRVQLYVATL